MTESSVIYMLGVRIANWCRKQLDTSGLVGIFMTEQKSLAAEQGSIFTGIWNVIVGLFTKLFALLRLDKLLRGSIFSTPFIWCFLTVTLAPILPTMLVLALTLAGFLSLACKIFINKGEFKLKNYAVNKYIFIYAGIYIFATVSSVTLKESLFGGMLSVCFMLFFFVVVNSIETKRQLHLLMFFFISAGLLVALYGFYQFMFPSKFSGVWHDVDMFESISFRVYSTLDNPNVLGEYFLLVIPPAMAYAINSKGIVKRLYFLGCAAAMMLCLILTYSRGCYLGILLAAIIFMVLIDRRFIILGIFGLMLLPFVLPQTIIDRFLSIGNMNDSSTSYRFYIYMGTLGMLKDYWLCGIGPGTAAFNAVYPAYSYNNISAPHSHNLFLQIICDAGIFGIIAFVGIIYQIYKDAFIGMVRQHSFKNKIFIIAMISALSGFYMQSLFDYSFYNYRVMLLFWISAAMTVLFANIDKLKGEAA